MSFSNIAQSVCIALLLTACGSQPARGNSEPALLDEVSAAYRTALESAVSEALHGVPVTLAKDALTQESLLIVERRPMPKLQQPGLGGREMQMPEKFRLMTDGKDCWLLQLSDSARWPLPGVSCKSEAGS